MQQIDDTAKPPASPAPVQLRVYWQPCCTSCLKAKEFLAEHGFAFESINVREAPGALDELAALGVRSIPVIARGTDYVLAQDLDEVADFLGLASRRQRLSMEELYARLAALLAAAQRCVLAMPVDRWHTRLPQRERTWRDLGFHVAMIVDGYLNAARGGVLEFHWFEKLPPAGLSTPAALAAEIRNTASTLAAMAEDGPAPTRLLSTYYGDRPALTVLERTAWHVAQHCRQLESIVVDTLGRPLAQRLGPAELEGLPIPRDVWDREIVNEVKAGRSMPPQAT